MTVNKLRDGLHNDMCNCTMKLMKVSIPMSTKTETYGVE